MTEYAWWWLMPWAVAGLGLWQGTRLVRRTKDIIDRLDTVGIRLQEYRDLLEGN